MENHTLEIIKGLKNGKIKELRKENNEYGSWTVHGIETEKFMIEFNNSSDSYDGYNKREIANLIMDEILEDENCCGGNVSYNMRDFGWEISEK